MSVSASPASWCWLGLLTGASCLVGCAPVLLPFLVSRGPVERRAWPVVEFLAGRTVAYLLVFLPALWLGQRLSSWPGWRPLTALVTLLLAVVLLAHALGHDLRTRQHCTGWCGHLGRRVPFAAGLALGLTPCAPLALAVSALLTAGEFTRGLAFMVGFGLSSTAWLLPLLHVGGAGRREHWRGAAQAAMLLGGLWYLARGCALLWMR